MESLSSATVLSSKLFHKTDFARHLLYGDHLNDSTKYISVKI